MILCSNQGYQNKLSVCVFRVFNGTTAFAVKRLKKMAAEEVQGVEKAGLAKKRSKLVPFVVKTGCREVPHVARCPGLLYSS